MPDQQTQTTLNVVRRRVFDVMTGPPALAFVPAFCLAAFWFGGEGALLLVAAILPAVYLLSNSGLLKQETSANIPRTVRGLMSAPEFDTHIAQATCEAQTHGLHACIHAIQIDNYDDLIAQNGAEAVDAINRRVGDQISGMLRDGDALAELGNGGFAVCVGPQRQLSLELCIQMAARLQTSAEDAIAYGGSIIYANASIGFCQLSRAPKNDGVSWHSAALLALSHAQARGPSSIRAYSENMNETSRPRRSLNEEVADAIESGAIMPWFQPQISTDTGRISGFEALARWVHPVRGVLTPAEFLPAVEDAGLTERLGETMMFQSFQTLKAWDEAGVEVPCIGVNFSGSELANPGLVERIKWDLDRFDLTPERLIVEVLETVVATTADDIVTRNISALGEIGCGIDLDDFGTGNASFNAIRRFAISRIKIDRSFVTRADRDPDQQRMVSAILTMAERLEIETVAEGIESVGEHNLLAQLGCDHVQGYGIARPMPFDQTLAWISAHNAKLQDMPQIAQSRQK